MKQASRPRQRLRQMIEMGANVAGASTNAALSMVSGSPTVSVALAAIQATGIYDKVGTEIADRWLAPREQARIGGVLALSAAMLQSELERGRTLRRDDFFKVPPDGRSRAEEVMEGVLRKAQTEYEERKLPYLARLWSNACLDETLGTAKLNYLAKLAEQLTYRQFVIISMAGAMAMNDDANTFGLREKSYKAAELNMLSETAVVLTEIMVLRNLECVRLIARIGITQIVPSEMRIGTYGAALYNAMELHRVPAQDYQPVIDLLR